VDCQTRWIANGIAVIYLFNLLTPVQDDLQQTPNKTSSPIEATPSKVNNKKIYTRIRPEIMHMAGNKQHQ